MPHAGSGVTDFGQGWGGFPAALSSPPSLESTTSIMTTFETLGLAPALTRALATIEYTTPTPIQAQAIPPAMLGRDLQGIAQTGTGKTAAFALPLLHRMLEQPNQAGPRGARTLVLAPTRELASQIAESFRTYGRNTNMRVALVFGGVSKSRQVTNMARGVDVLVATPGRLLDLMGDRAVDLSRTTALVLDEADHMLDLGFIIPIRRIVATMRSRNHTMLFSATMPKEIAGLAADLLKDPVHVAVAPVAATADRIEQSVLLVPQADKRRALSTLLARTPSMSRALVFTRTKHGADKVTQHLDATGVSAAAIHGNKSQGQRERALAQFKAGQARVLVATDIAARGIDVDGVSHVVNFDLPNVPEAYVHRIGRTARAGKEGIAISFCDPSERAFLRDIEKLIRMKVPVATLDA